MHRSLTSFFFKQKTAYEIYQVDWSSDVCSSDLEQRLGRLADRGAVDVDVPARHGSDQAGPAVPEVDHSPAGRDDDALARPPRGHRQLRVGDEVPPLAVHR